jgi:hypothetical protein
MTNSNRRLVIEVSGLEGARLLAPALESEGAVVANAGADGVTNVRMHVVVPNSVGGGSHRLTFTIRDLESGETATSASAFLAGEAP